MQQTFWLIGKSEYDTIQPKVVERRNAICPQLFEAPDLTQDNDENDEVFEVCDNDSPSFHSSYKMKLIIGI